MKALLAVILLILLSGCTTASVVVTDKNGLSWNISYSALGKKDLKDITAKVGDVEFGLGSATTDAPTGTDKLIDAFITGKIVPSDSQ